MKIETIVIDVLRKIGREDLADSVEDGGTPVGEGAELVQTVLYCINAVEDELARYYFPLPFTEKLNSDGGFFGFSTFSRTPVKILGVKADGKELEFSLSGEGLTADAVTAEVSYYYTPKAKAISGNSEFGTLGDGRITALGAAAEYCLICGETALAEVWETRYREAIDRARNRITKGAYVPPRRWV